MSSGKPAVTATPLHPILAERWSSRAFESGPLAETEITALLEAARWAPSSANEQPWRIVVVTHDDASFPRLLAALAPGNQVWAGRAPLLLAVAARTHLDRNGAPNRYAWHDAGLATAQLVAQATALGLTAHIMGGFDTEKVRAALAVPEGHDLVSVVAVGRRAAADTLPGELRDRDGAPRTRKPLESIAFRGRFGEGLAIRQALAARGPAGES